MSELVLRCPLAQIADFKGRAVSGIPFVGVLGLCSLVGPVPEDVGQALVTNVLIGSQRPGLHVYNCAFLHFNRHGYRLCLLSFKYLTSNKGKKDLR